MAISARRIAPLPIAAMLLGASPVAKLTVDLDQLRNSRGMVRLCLTAVADGFPDCSDEPRAVARSVPADQHSLSYDGLPPGDYAVAVVHDENGNGKLDTFAGIPREGFGFSRNPRITFGPPRFTSARFALMQTGNAQRIKMRYML